MRLDVTNMSHVVYPVELICIVGSAPELITGQVYTAVGYTADSLIIRNHNTRQFWFPGRFRLAQASEVYTRPEPPPPPPNPYADAEAGVF